MVYVIAAAVRSLFPVMEEESEPDCRLVPHDDINFCNVGVQTVASGREVLMTSTLCDPVKI
jgi:hypothetical protein